MLEAILRLTCAIVTVTGLAAFGWAVTLRLDAAGVARLTRWTVAFVVSAAAATVVFLVLAFARLVGLTSLLAASVVLAAVGARTVGRERFVTALADDFAAVRETPKRVSKPVLVVLAIVVVAHVVLAAAAAISPPLGFDSLMYHFVHVAYWAQDGGFDRHPGVDAWGYYEFFPIGGEILWAWVAIPARSVALVGPANVTVSMMAALGTMSAARSLGASLDRSVLAAVALVSIPAVSAFATTGYVDNTALAFVVAGTALFLAAVDASAPVRRVLVVASGLAMGLAVGAKPTMISMLVTALVASLVLLVRRRTSVRETAAVLVAALSAAALVFLPRQVYVALATGSPFYPVPVHVFGREIARGNLEFEKLHMVASKPIPPLSRLIADLFVTRPPQPDVNFGTAGIALFAAGAIGIVCWLRFRPRDGRGLFFLALAVPTLTFFFGESSQGFRTTWWWVIGRFMTAAVFSAVLFAAAAPARRALRIVDLLLGFAALAGVIVPITHGMCAYRWIGALPAAGAFAGVIAFCAFVWREHRRAASALLGAGIIGVVALVVVLRGELEGLVARGAGRGECYEAHRGPRAAAGFPLWERLADEKPSRIAVVGGFDGIGHEVFRYHFLGRSWQHRLVYVSPTVDGKLYDHPVLYPKDAKADAPELSFDRWRDRLREARVDYVVLVGPYNVMEHRWLVMHPELFHLEEVSAVDAARLYSVVVATTETQMKP